MSRYLFLIVAQLVQGAWFCPELCACKWKNGKQTVECAERGLTLVPSGLDPGTQVLDVSGNDLRSLPDGRFVAVGLVNLQKVFMARCRVARIHDDAFEGLTNLVELDLSQNQLAAVPSAIFSDFPSLMRLSLSENPISALRSNGFQHLTFLTTLELSDCEISLVEDEAFIGLSHLEWLKLDGNRLTTMRGSRILPDTLHGVDLHDNRWRCDCNSRDLHAWLSNFNVPHAAEPECSSPRRLAGRAIRSLTEGDLACLPDVSPTTFYLEIGEGKNVSLLCRVSAVPEARVSWWFQGQVLQNDSTVAPGVHLYYYVEEGTVDKRSELFIYNTNSEDNGTFACVAENPAGKSQSNYTIRVIVKEEPAVVVVAFPFEYALAAAVGASALLLILAGAVAAAAIKCRRGERRRKKKESSGKDVAMRRSAADAAPPKTNGSITVSDRRCRPHSGVALDEDASRGYQPERNPDLVNDAESGGRKESDEARDSFDALGPPPRQVKWLDRQCYGSLPRGARADTFRLVADVHLNPGCFLDGDGYPADFGLPRLPPQRPDASYRTLPHNRVKGAQAVRFAREAEFFAADVRYTVEGYPRAGPFAADGVFAPSPPEGYAGDEKASSESPDEGYVGDGAEI